ncbi:MAG: glycosyltransferase family 4 protein [Planctomycetaceae bacterium]|jgi:glycosyltransferase involved in cell wall biosynthesis|nr:glycosyltransferase family 4 protein [Planctomycetaceae bacterium]
MPLPKPPSRKICLVSTAPALMYLFHRGLIPVLQKEGWEITGLTSSHQPGFGEEDYFARLQELHVKMIKIPVVRDIEIIRDLWCFFRLWHFFLWNRFHVIHASNPKAMLLATLAAFFAFHPNRVITVRGRIYENSTGWKRRFFVRLDRLTCFLAHRVIVVSHSLRDAMLRDGIGTPESLITIGHGSSQGCDAVRFSREQVSDADGMELRKTCRLSESDKVILFAGRRRKDKGVQELVQAFTEISPDFPDWHLVLFGHEEKASDIGGETRKTIESHTKIHAFDWTSDIRTAYRISDIFVLPTWREGFPNTVLEASAMELPVITTTAVGAIDSVIDNQTGFLIPVNRADLLAEKMRTLILQPDLRKKMGKNGRKRIFDDFDPKIIWNGILEIYGK